MARMRFVFGILKAFVRAVIGANQYLRRRNMKDQQRPRLKLDFIHAPSWGAEQLAVGISNDGGGAARNCRYFRLQEFSMAGPLGHAPSFSTRRWYASERLAIPPASQKRTSARLTLSPCPQSILSDLVDSGVDEGFSCDAIVCEDSVGTVYRFRCHPGAADAPDIWSAGLLDRLRGLSAPDWAASAKSNDLVERATWSDVK